MYIYICIYIYAYIYIYVLYTCLDIYIFMYVYVHIYIVYIYMYIFIFICISKSFKGYRRAILEYGCRFNRSKTRFWDVHDNASLDHGNIKTIETLNVQPYLPCQSTEVYTYMHVLVYVSVYVYQYIFLIMQVLTMEVLRQSNYT
jgi:hypothetical protein